MKKKNLLMTAIAIFGLATITSAQAPSYVPTTGLVGYWPFNGNATDESGNGLNGTGSGSPTLTQDRFGVANKAYSFDGIDDYISVTRAYQSAFSLSIWFNPSTTTSPQYNPLVDAFDANWEVQLKNRRPDFVSFITSTNYQEFISTQTTTNNNWHHLVCAYSSNTVTFYLNGNQTDQYTVNPLPNNNGYYHFGASLVGFDQFYNGRLDDIGIWNRALTSTEITALFNSSTVGINEVSQNNLFSVYPNPAHSQINVKADATLLGSVYTVYDNTGKVVLSGKINSENIVIELGNLSGGIYFFSVEENMKQTFKVIKE
tara:strand:- start:176 stop:1120 length:945 start_codon:yes stop_codon:yes gene_type:complete